MGNVDLSNVQAPTQVGTQTNLILTLTLILNHPRPLMPVTPHWSWMLSPLCVESRCFSRAGKCHMISNRLKGTLEHLWFVSGKVFSTSVMQEIDITCVTRFFWRVNSQSSRPQQNVIKTFWPEIPENVDAAYESGENYNVYIFKGRPKDSRGPKPSGALLNTV